MFIVNEDGKMKWIIRYVAGILDSANCSLKTIETMPTQ